MTKHAREVRHWKRETTLSYWSADAVRARREAKEVKRAATLARESEKQAGIEYRAIPFHNDEEELAYLIAQQGTDDKYGNDRRYRKQDGALTYSLNEDIDGERTYEEWLDNEPSDW